MQYSLPLAAPLDDSCLLPVSFPCWCFRYWITNSAVHAQWAVVFAQLAVAGRQEGIHGFLVRIRYGTYTMVHSPPPLEVGGPYLVGLGSFWRVMLSIWETWVAHLSTRESSLVAESPVFKHQWMCASGWFCWVLDRRFGVGHTNLCFSTSSLCLRVVVLGGCRTLIVGEAVGGVLDSCPSSNWICTQPLTRFPPTI